MLRVAFADRGAAGRGVTRRLWLAGMLLGALAACGPQPPIRVGLLAGLTDRDPKFSEDGRNGAILAVEQRNAAGGVKGRPLELVVQDYGPQARDVGAAVQALREAGAQAVVGPYSSRALEQALPLVDQARLLMLAPTATSDALVGLDDHLVRLNMSNRDSARAMARLLHAQGWRAVGVALDMRNPAYVQAWADELRKTLAALGARVAVEVPFGAGESFESVARSLQAGAPDGVLFVCSSVDAARLAQQVDKLDWGVPMAAAGWAGNDSLIEMGGKAVERMLLTSSYDRSNASPRNRAFVDSFRARFGRDPGFSAAASFDAVQVLAAALARAGRDETPRDAVLGHGPYDGVLQSITFDRFGDTERPTVAIQVRDGRFETLR